MQFDVQNKTTHNEGRIRVQVSLIECGRIAEDGGMRRRGGQYDLASLSGNSVIWNKALI